MNSVDVMVVILGRGYAVDEGKRSEENGSRHRRVSTLFYYVRLPKILQLWRKARMRTSCHLQQQWLYDTISEPSGLGIRTNAVCGTESSDAFMTGFARTLGAYDGRC